jgi:hypothetical protein
VGFLSALAERLDPTPNPYAHDPVAWVEDRLDEQVWSKQRDILRSIDENRRTAVHSANAVGKSFIAARAGAWWVDTHKAGSAWLVSTAANFDQVRTVLWQEIGTAHRKGQLIGRVNQTEWWIDDVMVGYGRKPPDGDATGFFGTHREAVLVIVDEASGIADTLWEAVNRIITGPNDRVLAIGNPDYEGSTFYKMCQPDSGWNVIHVGAYDTPAFTGEPMPSGSSLISQIAIDEAIHDYGVDSPQYQSKVLGIFPADRLDGIVPWSLLNESRGAVATERVGGLRVPVELGVDVAAGGNDMTVIFPRFGPRAGVPKRIDTNDPELIADETLTMAREFAATAIKVDWTGVGFGVTGLLRHRLAREFREPVEVHDVVFGGGAKDADRFVNQRAELWWNGRELARAHKWDLTECDERTLADLAAPRWFETKKGRIQVEDKDEVRKRLGRSPDDGDALLLAFYTPPIATPVVATRYSDERSRGRRRR